jgi:hypothetical protein
MTATVIAIVVVLGTVGWLAPWRATALPRPANPSPGPTLPATAAAIAYELERQLPSGVRLLAAYQYEKDPSAAAVYLDRGSGTGLVQLTIDSYPPTSQTCRTSSCRTGADGAVTAIAASTGSCLENTVVQRFRPDRVHVTVFVATCLMWDGQRYPPGRSTLTVDEAVALAADPHWGVSMDSRLVAEAAQRYPSLPQWTHE